MKTTILVIVVLGLIGAVMKDPPGVKKTLETFICADDDCIGPHDRAVP